VASLSSHGATVQQRNTPSTRVSSSRPWDDWRNSQRVEMIRRYCRANAETGRGHGCRPLTRTGFRDRS
jgi:hypothetical protein